MLSDGGKPTVGTEASMLGVRVPPNQHPDILPDVDGTVSPGRGGMSVAPHWRELPYFLIPRRLKPLLSDARGKNELACFRFGEGDFAESPINEELRFKPDSAVHGTIQPAVEMLLAQFQEALANTRNGWQIDETL